MAWLDGRIDLETRGGDTALFENRAYSIFPPLWTLISYAVYGIHKVGIGEPVVFPTLLYIAILAGPIPWLFYLSFRSSGADHTWAAVLALYGIAGTCLWPVASMCQFGWIYSNQHVAAQIGLAVMLLDLLGKKRLWLAGLGLMIATWSRYLCIFYAGAILWVAWNQTRRYHALLRAGLPIAVTIALPMILNWTKFGSPFQSGYQYIYAGTQGGELDKVLQPDGSLKFFAIANMPLHAYHMWLAPPWFDFSFQGLQINGPADGTGLFYGSPILLFLWVDLKRWWRDPARRALVLTSIPLILALLAYYGPGYGTPGYYRYTLDFSLVWLAVMAPWTQDAQRRRLTLICLLWSVFYFYMCGPAGYEAPGIINLTTGG